MGARPHHTRASESTRLASLSLRLLSLPGTACGWLPLGPPKTACPARQRRRLSGRRPVSMRGRELMSDAAAAAACGRRRAGVAARRPRRRQRLGESAGPHQTGWSSRPWRRRGPAWCVCVARRGREKKARLEEMSSAQLPTSESLTLGTHAPESARTRELNAHTALSDTHCPSHVPPPPDLRRGRLHLHPRYPNWRRSSPCQPSLHGTHAPGRGEAVIHHHRIGRRVDCLI